MFQGQKAISPYRMPYSQDGDPLKMLSKKSYLSNRLLPRMRGSQPRSRRKLMVESLENRLVMAAWNYTFEWSIYEDQLGDGLTAELDVDRNSNISPLDVLQVVNALNGSRAGLLHEMDSIENYRLDTNGNGYIEPLDALMIINRINLSGSETDGGEGEEDSPIKSPIKSQAYRYSEMAFAAFGTNEEILLGEKHSRRNTRR